MIGQILRPYQDNGVKSVFAEWEKVNATLGVAATGAGKTTIIAKIIELGAAKGWRALVLAHRTELVVQMANRLRQFGIDTEIEQADQVASTNFWSRTPAVVATPQTLFSGRNGHTRMQRFKPEDFQILIIDECFPAGTLIDGRPIETLGVGSMVKSYDHSFQKVEKRMVMKVHKTRPKCMVLVTLINGKEIICTAGHPFYTQRGYVEAALLLKTDVVFCITTFEEENPNRPILPHLRNSGGMRREEKVLRKSSPRLLLEKVHVGLQAGSLSAKHGGDKSEVRISENEVQQSNAKTAIRCEDDPVASRKDVSVSGRKRTKHAPANCTSKSIGCGDGMAYSHGRSEKQIRVASTLLQGGRGDSKYKTGNRSGRKDASVEAVEVFGFTQDQSLKRSGVASVEILEPANRRGFSHVCPDGFVYNIEVDGNHNYFAEGILVHNCHHYVSDKYHSVIQYFQRHQELKVLGVTATPDRHDALAMGKIFKSVAFDVEICDMIDQGYLVNIKQAFAKIVGLDYSGCRTTAGDLNGADLSRVLGDEKIPARMVAAAMDFGPDKRMLAFTADVKQAEKMCEIFNRYKPGKADWIYAGTPKELRKEALEKFSDGRTQIMCNCGILTEGYDNPNIEMIVSARPTKSRCLYSQIVGRGTRPLPGVTDGLETPELRKAAIASSTKPELIVLDFVGNPGRHSLASLSDILGGRISEEAKELANKRIKDKGKAANIREEMQQAEIDILRQMEEQKKRDAARRQHLVAKAEYHVTYIDPFDSFARKADQWNGFKQKTPLTDKQRAQLLKNGYNPDTMTVDEGCFALKKIFGPTDGQRKVLKSCGYSGDEIDKLKKWDCFALIEACKKNGWKRPAQKLAPPSSQEQGPDDIASDTNGEAF